MRTGLLAAGMANSEPVARQSQQLLCPTVSLWGMTEVGGAGNIGFLDSPEDDRRRTSGNPLPGWEQKVIDPGTGEELPFGAVGELCARGCGLMQEYYKKPEETAEAIDPEEWLHSGDGSTMREDGTIRFMGRCKDLLKVAWVIRERNEFVWIVSYDGPEDWDAKQAAYYGSQERAAVDPELDLAQYIAKTERWLIDPVLSGEGN